MPYKRYAAGAISGFVHEVLGEGRVAAEVAREAALTRQTGACWLKQFGLAANAHRLVHLPQLAPGPEPSTPVPASAAASAPGPGRHPLRAQMVRVWCLLLALAALRRSHVPAAELPVHLLEWLQPELARLRPAAGVFRVLLYERARAPP